MTIIYCEKTGQETFTKVVDTQLQRFCKRLRDAKSKRLSILLHLVLVFHTLGIP